MEPHDAAHLDMLRAAALTQVESTLRRLRPHLNPAQWAALLQLLEQIAAALIAIFSGAATAEAPSPTPEPPKPTPQDRSGGPSGGPGGAK